MPPSLESHSAMTGWGPGWVLRIIPRTSHLLILWPLLPPTPPSGTAFLLCVPPHPDVISPCDRPGPGWIIGLFRLLTPLPTPHLLIGLTSRGPFSRHPQASFLPLAASLAALSAECPSCSIYLAWPECPSISLHSFVTVK